MSGSFTVPNTISELHICGSGAGGGGSSTTGMGGASGSIVSNQTYYVTPGEVVQIVIGAGGEVDMPGEESSLGGLNIAGGAPGGYAGEGARRDTCGGTYHDGASTGGDYGGQAGIRGDGGDAQGGDGTNGAGGGSGGNGGNGLIIISYYLEDQS